VDGAQELHFGVSVLHLSFAGQHFLVFLQGSHFCFLHPQSAAAPQQFEPHVNGLRLLQQNAFADNVVVDNTAISVAANNVFFIVSPFLQI
jgi:hypothetical protein